MANIYLTKTHDKDTIVGRDRRDTKERGYLARFIGFALGFFAMWGSGGELIIPRSKLSVRRLASSGGNKSSESSSSACCAEDSLRLVII